MPPLNFAQFFSMQRDTVRSRTSPTTEPCRHYRLSLAPSTVKTPTTSIRVAANAIQLNTTWLAKLMQRRPKNLYPSPRIFVPQLLNGYVPNIQPSIPSIDGVLISDDRPSDAQKEEYGIEAIGGLISAVKHSIYAFTFTGMMVLVAALGRGVHRERAQD